MNDRVEQPLVLAVDDNPGNLQMVAETLERGGMGVALAGTPRAALAFLEGDSCDLVLMDLLMPDMNGLDLCRRLKADFRTRDIPVIFLTGMAELHDLVQCYEAGGVDYVTKPFRGPELLARVRTHIELARARREIRDLRGLLPVCAYCRKVRDGEGRWHRFEDYLEVHSAMVASHGICPACREQVR